jgi:Flp pilus assembly protein TadG
MRFPAIFRHDQNGAAAVEFAFAVPIIMTLFYGMAQFGIILLANAGIRHATDTAARAATVYFGTTPMTDRQIIDIANNNVYGVENGTLSAPTVIRGTSNGVNYVDITVAYSAPVDLLVYQTDPIELSETRRAYLP